MAEMEQRVVLLTKALKDKDLQIATLMNKLKVQDLGESSHGHKFTSAKDDEGREIVRPTPFEGRRGFAPILEVFQGGDALVDDLVSCKRVKENDCLDLDFLD